MTFIVWGQFKYIHCKCLAKTILLLDMYKPSDSCSVHITCPMQTLRKLDKQLCDECGMKAYKSVSTHDVQAGGGHANPLLRFPKAPSSQVRIYLVFLNRCISALLLLNASLPILPFFYYRGCSVMSVLLDGWHFFTRSQSLSTGEAFPSVCVRKGLTSDDSRH